MSEEIIYQVQSNNQLIYLCHDVGWGCPKNPSWRLIKTHDNKNDFKRLKMYKNK